MNNKDLSLKARIVHRYLGFFLAGIMAVYAISGTVLIFRKTDFLKSEKMVSQQLDAQLQVSDLGTKLKMGIKNERTEGDVIYFDGGSYNVETGMAEVKKMKLPFVLDKMVSLHKATTKSLLYYFNIFFGFSLLFFVLSAFWMFLPSMPVFKKGLYYTIGGIILTLIMLFL